MIISILSIGDELCIGQVLNTNAHWMANKLTSIGAVVKSISVVGDDKELIINEIDRLKNFSDVILLTGGLGPTHDDITKSVLLEYFNDELKYDNDTFENLKELFKSRNRIITETNKLQAYLPSKCKVLTNKVGTAPGMMFEFENKILVSMPGVPEEMKWIMQNDVLPSIEKNLNGMEKVVYRTLLVSGIPESTLSDKLGKPETFLNNASLAFLPSAKGVRLRIGVNDNNPNIIDTELNRIEDYIRSIVGKNVISSDHKSLLEIVSEKLRETNLSISVAESCTGGLLGSLITEIPGASEYFKGGIVTYSNDIKINNLNVDKDIINKYGAVSSECAYEMAYNCKKQFKSDLAISITGIAGPDGGTMEKPVGLVYIGFATKNNTNAFKYHFWGHERNIIRERAVNAALKLMYDYLMEYNG